MPLSGTVARAPAGLIGFDETAKLNSAQAKTSASKGYKFCVRYVSRNSAGRAANASNGTPDLSAGEAQTILDAGLALMVVQHCPSPGWSPTGALGEEYGQNAATYTADAEIPPGVNVFLDLEGIAPGTAHSNIIAYANQWFAAVQTGGYVPGVYVGFNVFLSPDELFLDLTTQHYWRADGNIPNISHRGYQLIQHIQNAGTPSEFDRDVTQDDALGDAVLWLTSNQALVAA
jgi:hypothetical protein